jgi:transcriptional regulator with XRE-family HTH domain
MTGNHNGYVIRERRYALGLLQREVAERVGCSVAHISLIEAGKRQPGVKIAHQLKRVLGLDPR